MRLTVACKLQTYLVGELSKDLHAFHALSEPVFFCNVDGFQRIFADGDVHLSESTKFDNLDKTHGTEERTLCLAPFE